MVSPTPSSLILTVHPAPCTSQAGHAFLGGFTSNAARLAFSLMGAGDEGCLQPYQSTDINWCFAFGKGGHGVIRLDGEACQTDELCSQGC